MEKKILKIPVQVIYRLESDNRIVKTESLVFTLELDEYALNNVLEATLLSGQSFADVCQCFATEEYTRMIDKDMTRQEKIKALATKHGCTILAEVKLRGKVSMPQIMSGKH